MIIDGTKTTRALFDADARDPWLHCSCSGEAVPHDVVIVQADDDAGSPVAVGFQLSCSECGRRTVFGSGPS